MMWKTGFKFVLITGLFIANAPESLAEAKELPIVRFDDSIRVANMKLILNGAGIRYKTFLKVYAAGLYLNTKTSDANIALTQGGTKRIVIIILRDLNQDEFGRGFMAGIQQNTEKAERLKLVGQFLRLGEMFASSPEIKKGDILNIDWSPEVGTLFTLNGKKMAEAYPDPAFYHALLRLWLGEKPLDNALKKALLGEN